MNEIPHSSSTELLKNLQILAANSKFLDPEIVDKIIIVENLLEEIRPEINKFRKYISAWKLPAEEIYSDINTFTKIKKKFDVINEPYSILQKIFSHFEKIIEVSKGLVEQTEYVKDIDTRNTWSGSHDYFKDSWVRMGTLYSCNQDNFHNLTILFLELGKISTETPPSENLSDRIQNFIYLLNRLKENLVNIPKLITFDAIYKRVPPVLLEYYNTFEEFKNFFKYDLDYLQFARTKKTLEEAIEELTKLIGSEFNPKEMIKLERMFSTSSAKTLLRQFRNRFIAIFRNKP